MRSTAGIWLARVYRLAGKPCISLPRTAYDQLGRPERLATRYAREQRLLLLKPDPRGDKKIVDPLGKPRILLPKAVYEDMGMPSHLLLIHHKGSGTLLATPIQADYAPDRRELHIHLLATVIVVKTSG